MNKLYVLVVMLATAAGSTAFGAASEAAPVVAEDFVDGAPVDGGADGASCNGVAPDDFICVTGVHQRSGFGLSHGFTGMFRSDYSGTIESKLQYAGGDRTFQCTINNGRLVRCAGSGAFPPQGTIFVHICQSYDAGTTNWGGSGGWGCYVRPAGLGL